MNRSLIFINIIILTFIGTYPLKFYNKTMQTNNYRNLDLFLTEVGKSTSFDPINADKSHNINVMRMLYATPLEIDRNNNINSRVLNYFRYVPATRTIKFEVKNDLKFADGTKLSVDDVVLAILRMAFLRPEFPVIKHISGLSEWLVTKPNLNSFPRGIQVKDNEITIVLTKNFQNPLFRFCLELFSIIPKSCINLNTGALNCSFPSPSGNFTIKYSGDDKVIFRKRANIENYEPINFDIITFHYLNINTICDLKLKENQVITCNELDYRKINNCNLEINNHIKWLPSSRFGVLRYNPFIEPFTNADNRRLFSKLVRQNLRKTSSELQVESSLFTKLMQGYLDNAHEDKETVSNEDRIKFKNKRITIPTFENSTMGLMYDAVKVTAVDLGMKINFNKFQNPDDLVDSFIKGDLSVITGASGFWAQDPVGDMLMWFTKNLHKTMTFVWQDNELYRKLDQIDNLDEDILNERYLKDINYHIINNSIIAPVLHFKRILVVSKSIANPKVPLALTSPAPWQIIN